MEVSPRNTDIKVNTQLTEKNFFKTDYLFDLHPIEEKLDKVIDPAFENLEAILGF